MEDEEILCESMYCGEYFVKKREKLDGHSFKQNPFTPQYEQISVERTRQHENLNNKYQKLQEVAVTDIDSYFDYGFWKIGYGGRVTSLRPLNSPDKWEDVEEFLENNAVKKSKEFSRSDCQTTFYYDLPVSGHVLCANVDVVRNRKKKMEGWLHWNGKFHDPSFLYFKQMNGTKESFTKLCPLLEGREDPMLKLGYTDETKKMNRVARGVLSRHKRKERLHLEIDLGRVCVLDHIGTLGAYPKEIDTFPPYDPEKRNTRVNWIYVVNSEYHLSWVTKYIIHYRDIVTGKWVVYEHPLDGNNDITTEVIHKISIMARYIRVIPLDFHHQKEMRVILYGEPWSNSSPASSLLLKQKKRSKRIPGNTIPTAAEETPEEIQTIRYAVHHKSPHHVLDGVWRGCSKDCPVCYSLNFDNRRRNFRKLVKDEIDCVYDNEEFHDLNILF